MNTQVAQEFLTRCFAPGETIALLMRSDSPAKVTQRIVTLESALAPRYLAWLSYENAHGMNIYVAANPLRSGSRKRMKESIASVRHLYLDIDTDGDTKLASLRSSHAVPPPSAILSTSPCKYQVLWQVEGFDFELQEAMLKQLAMAYGGDPACTDRNRVLRVPGFGNCKYRPVHEVAVDYPSASVCTPSDFHLDAAQTIRMLFPHSSHARKQPTKQSASEGDWAWVCGELARGTDALKLTRDLTSRRSDKPNPLYYAQRTVDIASARLWVIDGVPMEDIITMLRFRRRFEIPAAFCSARAREITETAKRMITRRKIA